MECLEARGLIRAGAIPGAGEGRIPQLGFHLSVCPACRAFRRIDAHDRAVARAARRARVPARRRSFDPRRLLVSMARAAGLLLLLALGGMGWSLGLPLVRAWYDVAAMTSLRVGAPISHDLPVALRDDSAPLIMVPKAVIRLPESAHAPSRKAAALPVPVKRSSGSPPVRPRVKTVVDADIMATPASSAHERAAIVEQTALPSIGIHRSAPVAASPVSAMETSLPVQDVASSSIAGTPRPELSEAQVEQAGAITILVLGIDARPGEVLARSDAIMLVRLDPRHQRITLLSLPRDLLVPIPDFGEGKIDSAYFLGEQYGEGAAVATQTVAQALNINIDRTAVVDFEGFKGLIDALGGIRIEIPRELYDPQFPTEDFGYTVAHFLPGEQMMDGERALMYSRIRHPDSDFERMHRQQAVGVGIAERLRERGVLRNLREADRITAALRPYIHTDLPRPLALNLLWSMRSADVSAVKRITADTSLLTETSVNGAYALIAEPSTLHDLGAQLVAAPE